MDILTAIASWTGWLGVAALLLFVGGVGVWIYFQRIDFYKEKLQDIKDDSPDILVKRLKDRHKLLSEELEIAEQEREKNKQRIGELEAELSAIKADIEALILEYNATLSELNEIYKDKSEPRDGKVREDVFYAITSTIMDQSAIFIPIIYNPGIDETFINLVRNNPPYKIQIILPGMMKLLFFVYDNRDEKIGEVFCPYFDVYYKDYYFTLSSKVLSSVPSEWIHGNPPGGPVGTWVLPTAEFHAVSPIDPRVYFLRIPCKDEIPFTKEEGNG